MMRHLVVAIAGVLLALADAMALAQGAASYPSKLVKIIVPFPPGGATDIMTRNIAQKLNEAWKQPVVVENRPGANGMVGADAVAKSQGDGSAGWSDRRNFRSASRMLAVREIGKTPGPRGYNRNALSTFA